MTVYEYVKKHSGLSNNNSIEKLCYDIKDHMIRNNIEKITPSVVKEVQRKWRIYK